MLAVIAAGGALGSLARFGVQRLWPAAPYGFDWATLTVNVVGCGLIGVLMVLVSDVWSGRRLLRPFLGVGVLGGFTTFSAYAVAVPRLITTGHPALAGAYLVGTAAAALGATWLGVVAARRVTRSTIEPAVTSRRTPAERQR